MVISRSLGRKGRVLPGSRALRAPAAITAKSASCAAPSAVKRTRLPAGVHLGDVRTDDAATRARGAVEQKPVEYGARVDDDGMIEGQQRAMAAAGDEFDRVNNFLGGASQAETDRRRMALWVRPPPQGFSQARCSS